MDLKIKTAKLQAIPIVEACFLHSFAIDENAVGAIEVDDSPAAVGEF